MAITIITTPKIITPVYNNIVLTASSDNTSEDNFSYLVDVYINGSATKTIRLRIPPRPDGYLYVNIAQILEQNLSFDLMSQFNTESSLEAVNSTLTYIVKIGESYDVSGVLTDFEDLYISPSYYGINASLTKKENIEFSYIPYLASDSLSSFMTNSPRTQNTSITDTGFLSIINTLGGATQIKINTYDDSNTLISTFYINLSNSGFTIQTPCYPLSLNTIDNSHLTTGSQPIITSSVSYYTYVLLDASNNAYSETFTFNLVDYCEDFTRLIFQNRLGQFDAFNFTKKLEEKTEVSKGFYKKTPNTLVSGVYSESLVDREKVQHYTKTTPSIIVESDWLTEEENNWLVELIESPLIYMERDLIRYSVEKINLSSHTTKNKYRDKLFKIELEISLGFDNYRQRS